MPAAPPRKTGCPTTTDDPARDSLVASAETQTLDAVKVGLATLDPLLLGEKTVRQSWFTYHRRLANAMSQHGIVDPTNALNAAVYANVPAAVVCTSLLMESWGGENKWGGDPGGDALPWQWFEHWVTPDEWTVYWGNVQRGLTTNGCGPSQLTSRGLQEAANSIGGCWLPGPNMKVGAIFMRQLLVLHGGDVQAAFTSYNGSGPAAVRYGETALGIYNLLHTAFVAVR